MIFPRQNTQIVWGGQQASVETTIGDGTQNSLIAAVVRWLQRSVPEATLRVRERDAEGTLTPLPEHRMLQLLAHPNPYYDGIKLLQGTIASREVDGNAYWYKVRNAQGAVVELWWIPHGLIEPKRGESDTNQFITHYEYTPSGVPIRLAVEDVVHFRQGLDPANPMLGLSPVKSLIREVLTDEEASAFTSSLLRNFGVPGVVVSPAGSDDGAWASDEDAKTTKRMFEQATTGANRGRTIVMTAPTKIEAFGFSPEQMNLRALRQLPEERVSAVMGVPAVVVGFGAGLDRSTFSNMSEARDAAYESKILPDQREISAEIHHQLLRDFEPAERLASFVVDFDNSNVRVLQDDEDKTAARVATLLGAGAITVAEAREPFGLPIDDSMRIYLRPLNLIEVSADDPRVTDDAVPKQRGVKRTLPAAAIQRFRVALIRDEVKLADAWAPRIETTFADLGRLAADAWAAQQPKDHAATSTKQELTSLDVLNVDEVIAALGLYAWRDEILGKLYQRQYREVAFKTMGTLGDTIGLTIERPDPIAEAVIRKGGRRASLVNITQQTRSAILDAVADGRAAGLNPVQIERQIREYVENGSSGGRVSARAMRIARTETQHAQRISCLASYEATGVYQTVIMLDDLIGHGDDECGDRDGREVSYEEAEAEAAAEHPNGTLQFAPGRLSDRGIE